MKDYLILLICLSFFSLALCQANYKAVFLYKTINTVKGSFNPIAISFELDKATRLYQVTGKLIVPPPLVLADEVIIDTLKERKIVIHIGFPCSYKPAGDLKATFSIDGSNKVEFPELTFKVTPNKAEISLSVNSPQIAGGSYGLYYALYSDEIRNVDSVTINIAKAQGRDGTVFNSLVIPPFDKYRDAMQLKSSFSTPPLDIGEAPTEQKGTVSVASECFTVATKTISFKITNKGFAVINEKTKKDIVDSVQIHNVLTKDYIQMKFDYAPYPSVLTCSVKSKVGSIEELLNKLRNINDAAKDTSGDFRIRQYHVKDEHMEEVIFSRVNRFAQDMKFVCLIEDMNADKKKVKSIHFVIGNDDSVDKKIDIHTVPPAATHCAVWSFEASFDNPKAFEMKAANYCGEHFAIINRDAGMETSIENGCLQCDVNSYLDGTFDKPQKAICVRSRPDCPSDFSKSLDEAFSSVVKEMDSKEKIQEKLGIVTSPVESVEIYKDDDQFDLKQIKVTYGDSDGGEFSINILNDLQRSVSCAIKKHALRDIPTTILNSFFDRDGLIMIFKAKETKTVHLAYQEEYSHSAYDNKLYHVYLTCSSIATDVHYYEPKPYIGLTILRTNAKPTKEESVPKPNCKDTPFIPECLKHTNNKPLPFKNPSLALETQPEVDLFYLLAYPYQKLMLEAELTSLEKMTEKIDIINEALYISQLLSSVRCQSNDNYAKCREFKQTAIARLIKVIQAHYPCNLLIKNIWRTSGLYITNHFRFLSILFQLGNNPETYTKDTFPFIFDMTHCIITNKDLIIKDFHYSLKEKETLEDYYQLYLSHSINLIEVINHLEADQLIAPTKSGIIKDAFVDQYKNDIEVILKDLLLTNITSFTYNSFSYMKHNRSDYIENDLTTQKQQLLKKGQRISYYINDLKMKLSFEADELFNQTNSTYISFHIWKQYPLLSMKPSNYSANVVSFRAYQADFHTQTKAMEISEVHNVTIDSYPVIRYNYSMVNDNFTAGYMFNNDTKEFMTNYTQYKNLTMSQVKYGEVSLEQVGDFTIGVRSGDEEKPKAGDNLLMIILLSVGGALLLGVGGFFLFKYVKKKRERVSSSSPLIPEGI